MMRPWPALRKRTSRVSQMGRSTQDHKSPRGDMRPPNPGKRTSWAKQPAPPRAGPKGIDRKTPIDHGLSKWFFRAMPSRKHRLEPPHAFLMICCQHPLAPHIVQQRHISEEKVVLRSGLVLSYSERLYTNIIYTNSSLDEKKLEDHVSEYCLIASIFFLFFSFPGEKKLELRKENLVQAQESTMEWIHFHSFLIQEKAKITSELKGTHTSGKGGECQKYKKFQHDYYKVLQKK